MGLLLIIIPVCFFAAERLASLVQTLCGAELYYPLLLLCSAAGGAAVYFITKKRKIKNRLYIALAAAGAAVGFALSGVTCARGILAKTGGGILICVYLYVIVLFLSEIKWKKPKKDIFIFVAATAAAANVCAALYAFSCQYIYYWDNAVYWTFARDIAGGSISRGFFTQLYNSVLTFDYNYLAALLPALFAYLFGPSRTVYIFAVVNCCFVPAALSLYMYSRSAERTCAVLLMLPLLLFLALTGFVDVCGFSLCVLCYMLYNTEEKSFGKSFLTGALLALLVLIRRWYAFFGVSFIAAAVADCVMRKRNIRFAATASVNAGFILVMFFSPLVEGKLMADYASVYAGYKFSLMTDVRLFARYFGAAVIALTLGGAAWCAAKRDRRVVMPLVQTAMCFLLFVRTQTHGQQHLLLYAPAAAVLMLYALERLDRRAVWCVMAAAVCVSANTLLDRVQPQSLSEIRHIAVLPDFSMRGRKRDDAYEILNVKNELDARFSDGRLGVNASSFVINADILKNVQPSLGEKDAGGGYIYELPCVDSRDTDMSRFYDMDYILTAFPVQVHLGEDKQTVVARADRCLREGTAFGAAYERTDAVFSAGGVTLTVYRRTREVTDGEKREFEESD